MFPVALISTRGQIYLGPCLVWRYFLRVRSKLLPTDATTTTTMGADINYLQLLCIPMWSPKHTQAHSLTHIPYGSLVLIVCAALLPRWQWGARQGKLTALLLEASLANVGNSNNNVKYQKADTASWMAYREREREGTEWLVSI